MFPVIASTAIVSILALGLYLYHPFDRRYRDWRRSRGRRRQARMDKAAKAAASPPRQQYQMPDGAWQRPATSDQPTTSR
jgi:peptidoglycan/LPS O-acetylase OafA/YrhL